MMPSYFHSILVVDDDHSILRYLQKRLTAWNYRVATATSGRQGMAHVQSEMPDIVITDLYMPDGDGLAFLDHLHAFAPELPVIVMSGQGKLDDAIQALRLGAWDYLRKPIESSSLLRLAIERALEKARIIAENRMYRDHLEELIAQKNAALKDSEKRYRTVADFAYDWEYWIDPEGRIEYMSPSCERVTGYTAREFIEDPALLSKILHEDSKDIFRQHLDTSDRLQGICQLDFRVIRRDGQTVWIGHRCQEVRDPDGRHLGRRCSNRDMSYQKEIEINLFQQQQELLNKTANLEKVNEALKALLDHREIEKQSIEQAMVSNLKRFVLPYLDGLEHQQTAKEIGTYVNIIRTNMEQLISPVSKNLSGAYLDLTPTEIKVADFVRQGKSTKSIAGILNISPSTVEKHRNKIRKKLKILNKKINLETFLNSLA